MVKDNETNAVLDDFLESGFMIPRFIVVDGFGYRAGGYGLMIAWLVYVYQIKSRGAELPPDILIQQCFVAVVWKSLPPNSDMDTLITSNGGHLVKSTA